MDPVGEGGRNEALFKFASKLRGAPYGLGESDLNYFVHRANKERVSPSLTDKEVNGIIKSVVGRYHPESRYEKYLERTSKKSPSRKTFSSSKDRAGKQSNDDEPWGDNMVSENGTKPPKPPELHEFIRNDGERHDFYDLLLAWMNGVGPETPKFVWRDGAQAYSETYKRYMKATEILKFHQPDILCWLAVKSRQCELDPAEIKKKVTPVSKATKLWKHWSQTCYFKHLSRIPDKSVVQGVADSEEQKLAASIYAILSKSIRVNDNTDQIPINTTVLQQADDATAPGWSRVGKYGAYVRNPKKMLDASIGLRYDFVVQVGAAWLTEVSRKRLTRLLRENGIATSGTIKDSRKAYRCWLISHKWLTDYHGYLAEQEQNEDQLAESSGEKSAD